MTLQDTTHGVSGRKIPNATDTRPTVFFYAALIPPTFGGGEIFSHKIATGLAKRFRVILLTRGDRLLPSANATEDNMLIIRANRAILPLVAFMVLIAKRPFLMHVMLHDFLTPVLFLESKLLGIPTILTHHGTYRSAYRELIRYLSYRITFIMEHLVLGLHWSCIVAVDQFSAHMISGMSVDKTRRSVRVLIIPSAVDISVFRPMKLEEILQMSRELSINLRNAITKIMRFSNEGNKIILCPRRLERKNGLEYLVLAGAMLAKRGQKIYLVFSGRASSRHDLYAEELTALYKRSGLADRVQFLGNVPHTEMPLLYNISDVVAFPSIAEARSLAALEAMACGKAIVATNTGGLPEIVKAGYNGLLVPPAKPTELARAIEELLTRPEVRANIEKNALDFASGQNWMNRVQDYVQLYLQLIDSARRGRRGTLGRILRSTLFVSLVHIATICSRTTTDIN